MMYGMVLEGPKLVLADFRCSLVIVGGLRYEDQWVTKGSVKYERLRKVSLRKRGIVQNLASCVVSKVKQASRNVGIR